MEVLALTAGLALVIPCAQAESRRHELIYGAELMTPAERDAYRRSLAAVPDDRARERVERQHRERLHARAQRRGVSLREPDGVVAQSDGKPGRRGAKP